MHVKAISPPYMVEVSGTAPESKTSIMYNIYYHSLTTIILYNYILIFQEKFKDIEIDGGSGWT